MLRTGSARRWQMFHIAADILANDTPKRDRLGRSAWPQKLTDSEDGRGD